MFLNSSVPIAGLEAETGESLAWHTQQQTAKTDPLSNKVEGEEQHLGLSSDLHLHTHRHTQMWAAKASMVMHSYMSSIQEA